MASRLMRVSAALRLLPAASARAAPARHLAVPDRLATDEEQATGLERKVLEAMNKGLAPTACSGRSATRGPRRTLTSSPPSPTSVSWGVCEEDNSCVIWFWLHKGEAQRCPSCGAHYKLIPHELPH
ncbi:cytochrome c oxidase subunit 5B, mitochondrial isoform X1 [Falco rusticolus]|uniref:cytochrome c oxidase subunit 5B, mitochondrial isoform X1 n=1 Tax=Falco rusticolus TaxID=120794 RepID=UPI001886A271|nr:cytochrome c oxidase subunit 5B, mitochondrial isoform X1 [Falco rusticolus]